MPEPDARDLRILQACLTGDREPFAARFRPLIASVARRTAHARGAAADPASVDEICQEAYLSLFEDGERRLRQFDPRRSSLASWVALIARRSALHWLERAGRGAGRARDGEGAGEGPADPAGRAVLREEVARLRQALRSLPPREALCLTLLVEEGLAASEVASILGVARQSVYEMRDRALARLREAFGNR